MNHTDDTVHPLVAVGTALTTVGGAIGRYAPMVLGLLLSWLGFYLDLRVRAWIRRHVDKVSKPSRTEEV